MTTATVSAAPTARAWLRRFGAFGFAFFFIKGLLWLAAPLVFYHFL